MKQLAFTTIVLVAGMFVIRAVAQHEHPAGELGRLGKVNFPVSCDPSVQPQFNSAVAMLHSFWFEKASDTFVAVAHKAPTCGMAYWGIAMTHYHPIWEAPGPADLKEGMAAVEKPKSVGASGGAAFYAIPSSYLARQRTVGT